MCDFNILETQCLSADLDFGAAEVHGMLTGLVCAYGPSQQQHWLTLIYDHAETSSLNATHCDLWNQLYLSTLKQLTDNALNLQLLLPDDEQSLSLRIESLCNWCRGFLYGVSIGKLKTGPEMSADINEIIRDLTQITNVSSTDEDNNSDGEDAYKELCNYILASATHIYAELQGNFQTAVSHHDLH